MGRTRDWLKRMQEAARDRAPRELADRREREWAYIDSSGNYRSANGFFIGKRYGQPGDGLHGFRRDFTHLDGWPDDSPLLDGLVFDYDRELDDLIEISSAPFAGIPVPDYKGPYYTYNAVRYLRKKLRKTVHDWQKMRLRGHQDQRPQFPGYGGHPPEGAFGTYTIGRGYRPHKRVR